jgi:hypothetical protein
MERYIYLAGGFGNNLFQICYGLYLEKKGYKVIYKTFLRQKNFFTRMFSWSIHNDEMIESLLSTKSCDSKIKFSDIIFLTYTMLTKKIFRLNFYDINDNTITNKRYFGYCASGKHLSDSIFQELRELLKSYYGEYIQNKNSNCCSLHIRRGDFSENQRLCLDYYLNAVEKIEGLDVINLVTDDPSVLHLVKDRFGVRVNISQNSNMKEDFFELFNSKKVVMSNSTFCYWAVVLGDADFAIYPNRISTAVPWFFYMNKKSDSIDCLFDSEKA